MKNKNNIRQIIQTICGILCVMALLFFACIFPKYYCLYHDKSTLKKVNYIDIHVNTYETPYSSFADKLNALAKATTIIDTSTDNSPTDASTLTSSNTVNSFPFYIKKYALSAVQINESEIEMSREDLTKIVNKELKKLYNNHIIPGKLRLKDKYLMLHERYAIFATSEKNDFKGFSCWKLVYETKKKQFTLYFDEEYHKIYYLEVRHKTADIEDTYKKWSRIQYTSDTSVEYPNYNNTFSSWFYNMLNYYEIIYGETDFLNIDMENLTGCICLKDQNPIILLEEYGYDMGYNKKENFFWHMGLPIENMILF